MFMSKIAHIEETLDAFFRKNAPSIAASSKDFIVKYIPYVSLIMGLLSFLTFWSLWEWIRAANKLVDFANDAAAKYGTPPAEHVHIMAWVGLILLLAQAIFFLRAYAPLRNRQKDGWNFFFYAVLVDTLYSILVVFTDYAGLFSMVWNVIWNTLVLYFLFQIRSHYTTKKS